MFLILRIHSICGTALTEFECEMLNPFSLCLLPRLPIAIPIKIILPSETVNQTLTKCSTNKEILYTEWQLVKLWADMLTLLSIHVLHWGIISNESQKQSPYVLLANTKQDMTSMNSASREHVNQSIAGKKQYNYTFMRILNDKMYRICHFFQTIKMSNAYLWLFCLIMP